MSRFRQELKESGLAGLELALGNAHARLGQVDEAVTAFHRALDLADDHDARTKVLRAASAYDGILDKLAALRHTDAAFHDALARYFQARGELATARAAAATARTSYEQKLAAEPANSLVAQVLADVLLTDAEMATGWTMLKPTGWKSEGGATLTKLEDNSILASGKNSDEDACAFAGVQLDIEPHRAGRSLILRRDKPMWDAEAGGLLASERNRRIAEQYLDLLDAVGARIRGLDPPVRFAATIPTWFDRDTPRESYVLEHGGARQTLASLIQRRVDFVTLMDYLDGSGSDGADAAWSEIEQELDAGPVEALFETAPPRKGRKHPKPAETLFEEGETALFKMCEALRDRFADEPNYLGCAAHYYLHAVGSGLRGWPQYP